MAEPDKNEAQELNYRRLSRQNNLLFVAGALSVLAGLFFPKVPALVDLLMIFSMALSAAVIVISLGARKPTELTGFALLAITTIASLLTTSIASAKLIMMEETGGVIVTQMAKLNVIADISPAPLSAVIFCVISVVLLTATAKSDKKLLRSAAGYLDQLDGVEQSRPQLDSIVSDEQQNDLTAKEKGFFHAAHAFGRLAVWLSALTSVTVVLSIGAAMLASAASSVSSKVLVGLAGNCGLLVQTCVLGVVCAVSRLVRKSVSRSLQETRMTEEQFQQRIKVIAREVAATQTNGQKSPGSSWGSIDGYTSDKFLFDCEQLEDEASYDYLTNLLVESGSGKVLLMAACGPHYAPVTIPVNVAVRLAAGGLKTLIIDLDLKRSAVQRVFEAGNCDSRAVKTCIENISLISGKHLAAGKPQMLRQIFAKALTLYDYIVVYAPDAAVPQQMSEFLTAAIFFGADGAPIDPVLDNLIDGLNRTACRILTPSSLLQRSPI